MFPVPLMGSKSDKSPRNKTIQIDSSERRRLFDKLTQAQSTDIIPTNSLVLSDIFDCAGKINERSVDLLIADPPYNMAKQFSKSAFKSMSDEDYERWTLSWIKAVLPSLKDDASVYVCGDWKNSSAIYRALSKHFIIRNRICWEREKGRGAKMNWKNASEDIWFASRSKEYFFNTKAVMLKRRVIAPYKDSSGKPKDWKEEDEGAFRLTHPSNFIGDVSVPFWSMPENTEHPTQKPEKLIAKLILASSKEGDLILDPFCGSGTSVVCAKKLGRSYIGVEREEEYALFSAKRLEMAEDDSSIQGYDGVFYERNSKPQKK